MMRAIVAALVFCCCALALPALPARAEAAAHSAGSYIRSVGSLQVGDRVPAFRAKDLYGAEICLEDLIKSGRKPVLAFWSMYCQACVEKFNAMVVVQNRYADQGLAVISVNTDGEYQKSAAEIREFIANYERTRNIKINFPVLYDERSWLPQALKIEFLPTIITVDPAERIAGFYQEFNEASEEQIIAGIDALSRKLLALYPAGVPAAAPGSACPDQK